MTYTIALAGNPNVGKSTLFNALTGGRQHVGNWPGKTVERYEGRTEVFGQEIAVVDLPGTYSLAAYSVEEIIARDFLVKEQPSAVLAVVDAANLERNLYLVTQLLELEIPVIVALNMADIAESRGISIDVKALSARLGGIPIVETVGSREIGVHDLRQAIGQALKVEHINNPLRYDDALEAEIATLEAAIAQKPAYTDYNPRWLAIKLLEGDEGVGVEDGEIQAMVQAANTRLIDTLGDDAELLTVDQRYTFISDVIAETVTRPDVAVETISDKLDKVLTHRILGVPIFLTLMWIVFQITANVSAPFLDWVDGLMSGPITRWAGGILGAAGLADTWFGGLVVDGIIAGVGGVLVFVPVLMSLYLAIGLLEDSGYMARAAFVMDRVMRAMGLHGKSFLPMLVGFGCTVPAVYATRTLDNEEDRKLTGFLVTFMSCGARLPVYILFGAAFFGAMSGHLIFGMYLLGIIIALGTGVLAKHTLFKNKPPQPFVMELPPYRIPTFKSVWGQMWERISAFLKDAGTVIVLASMAVWLLLAVPVNANGTFNDVAPEDSVFGTVSGVIAPVFAPAGFGEWEASGSLITGLVAKEVVIGTMSQIYTGEVDEGAAETVPFIEDVQGVVVSFGEAVALTAQEIANIGPRTLNVLPGVTVGEFDFLGAGEANESTTGLEAALQSHFTPLAAVAFTTFILLYVPCMATLAAMRQEFGGRWLLYQVGFTLVIAWIGAVLVYQVGSLLGLG